jgi:hypothetical protein
MSSICFGLRAEVRDRDDLVAGSSFCKRTPFVERPALRISATRMRIT